MRPWRTDAPRKRTGQFHHAWQGEPDAVRGHNDGRRASDGQPCGGDGGRVQRSLRAQRLQAHDGRQCPEVDPPPGRQLQVLHDQLRRGNRTQQGEDRQDTQGEPDVGHRAEPSHRLRQGRSDRQDGAQEGPEFEGNGHRTRIFDGGGVRRVGQTGGDAGT